ncbi:hypothetical protein BB558_001611 [Smittium angustum]|uniref:DUF4246 domain-containing protein n=1 Tax=Smittium angustum TaxID=133377 RepID=A0A2U1JAX4_SMIAN|nr:hypothetical protein BB558_001611 [Smittium angustum]
MMIHSSELFARFNDPLQPPRYTNALTDCDFGDGYLMKTVIEQNILKINIPIIDLKSGDCIFILCGDIKQKVKKIKSFTHFFVSLYIGNNCVSEELLNELKVNVAKLEDVPKHEKDWHPRSNKQVLDLVHPSIYPIVFGRTRGLTADMSATRVPKWDSVIGKGQVKHIHIHQTEIDVDPDARDETRYRLEKFQWIPTEFDVGADGKVKILSYINNLHPKIHENMYRTLEKIFEKFVPLFNNVLTDSCTQNCKNDKLRIKDKSYIVEEYVDYVNRVKKEGTARMNRDYFGEESDLDEYGYYYETYKDQKIVYAPQNYKFSPDSIPKNIISVDLKGSRLQVIVKLSNVILTPENPKYKEGEWHVEGIQNEEIVATGIYYYDQENITDSYFALRQSVCEPEYEEGDHKGVETIYGFENGDPLYQNLGKIKIVKNQMISFPNIYQHQVQDFELRDKTKPGYRKMLSFFLVNPKKRIYSTAHIPPQQLSWFEIELMKNKNKLSELPGLITDEISKTLDWPISLKEAKKQREELLKGRKFYVNKQNEGIFERELDLGE